MARPQKAGLDYFPLDVFMDQDDKIAMIQAIHGMEGFGLLITLLMKVYATGYYYQWGEKQQILFSKKVNVNINSINEFINSCIRWDIFNEELYNEYEILTSKGIQARYLEACKRRQQIILVHEYLLIPENELKNQQNVVIEHIKPINVDNNSIDTSIGTQRKGKESKVNKIKEDIPESVHELTEEEEQFISVLQSIDGYPLDLKKDVELIRTMGNRYPTLDLVEAVNQWSIFIMDNPFKEKSNPRSQMNTSFKKYVEWGKCTKKPKLIKNYVDPNPFLNEQ